uniref:Uncharacterized protein n=1 Tax=Nelumbo nucifera TaxID=4432 RepID=A0A822YYM6_NELNU|nr:TPA_asm: hypothetical protein HUJ06_007020 [Nelumbo nucifera]
MSPNQHTLPNLPSPPDNLINGFKNPDLLNHVQNMTKLNSTMKIPYELVISIWLISTF